MTQHEFVLKIKAAFPAGSVINNPGGGTSTITGYSETNASYIRGHSKITVAFSELYDTYFHFLGCQVSSSELKALRPAIFDSAARPAGHSCNCTFLFCLLEKLNLSGPISGSGVRGSPYTVAVNPSGVV